MIWFCPNCEAVASSSYDKVPMHECRFGLTTPFLPDAAPELRDGVGVEALDGSR